MASLEKSTIETSEFKSDSITDTELSSVNGNGTLEDDVIDDGFQFQCCGMNNNLEKVRIMNYA